MPEQIDGFYQKVDAFGRKGIALEGERFRVLKQNAAIKRKNVAIAKENAAQAAPVTAGKGNLAEAIRRVAEEKKEREEAEKAAADKAVADKAAAPVMAVKATEAEKEAEKREKEEREKAAAGKAPALKVAAAPLMPLVSEPDVYFFKSEATEALGATQSLFDKIFGDDLTQADFADPAFREQKKVVFSRDTTTSVSNPKTRQELGKEWNDINHDRELTPLDAEYNIANLLLYRLSRTLEFAQSQRAPVLSENLNKSIDLVCVGLDDLTVDRNRVERINKRTSFNQIFTTHPAEVKQKELETKNLPTNGVLTAAEIADPGKIDPAQLRQVLEMFHTADIITPEIAQEIAQKMQQDLDWRCGYGRRMLRGVFKLYDPWENPDSMFFC